MDLIEPKRGFSIRQYAQTGSSEWNEIEIHAKTKKELLEIVGKEVTYELEEAFVIGYALGQAGEE